MKLFYICLLFLFFSCKNERKDYSHIKNDLYTKNDSLYILKKAPNLNHDKDTLYHYYKSIELNGNSIFLNSILDINTFSDKGRYYKDKNYIFIYNESPLYFPDLNAIKYNIDNVQFLGYDYYKIDNKIYFQSREVKNADPKTFVITQQHKAGYYYAKDDKNVFYKEKQVQGK